jgi:predicted PurR-regulated permease PerM
VAHLTKPVDPGNPTRVAETRAVPRNQAALYFALALVAVLAYLVFRYFLLTFAVAASVALLLAPAQAQLAHRLRGRRGVAAGALVALCAVLLLVPVLAYGALLVRQTGAFFDWMRPWIEPGAFEKLWTVELPGRWPLLAAWLKESSGGNAMNAAYAALSRFAAWLNDFLQAAVLGAVSAVFDLMIFLLMVFFLLRDGDLLRESLRGVSPLTRGQETEMLDHLTRTVKGTLLSMVLVPVAQGLVALPGFVFFGVPGALVWSAMTVFACLIPLVGSPLVWVPAAGYLFLNGHTGRAIGLIVYGIVVIASVDNILKPMILRGSAEIHTMLGFLSILGGVYAFGPKGVIVGPVVLSLILSAYRIYRFDVLRWRQAETSWPAIPPA